MQILAHIDQGEISLRVNPPSFAEISSDCRPRQAWLSFLLLRILVEYAINQCM